MSADEDTPDDLSSAELEPQARLSRVPRGHYCYEWAPKGAPDGEIQLVCPHWQALQGRRTDGRIEVLRARCNLLGSEDNEPRDSTLLWDRVKLCGLREPR